LIPGVQVALGLLSSAYSTTNKSECGEGDITSVMMVSSAVEDGSRRLRARGLGLGLLSGDVRSGGVERDARRGSGGVRFADRILTIAKE
jgi:hypothetical protein